MNENTLPLDDPLRVYLKEVNRIPPLSRAEEIECMEHVQAGDESAESARRRLVEANLLLVVSLAERYPEHRTHMLELIQIGNEGLLRAARTLTSSHHDHFSAQATEHIKRAIAEFIGDLGSAAD